MAKAYLHQKIKTGRFDPQFFAMSTDDLAIDCIAVLFERNDRGEFIRINKYFGSVADNERTGEMLLIHTRRLVFTVLNDELFRLYKIVDPSLGNVIRCIKSALREIPDLCAERTGGDVWLYVANGTEHDSKLPVIPDDILYLLLEERFSSSISIRRLMDEFTGILKTQHKYRKRYPLTGLAYCIRTLYMRAAGGSIEFQPAADDIIDEADIRLLISESTGVVKRRMKNKYVDRKQIPPKTYHRFFRSIESILISQYVGSEGSDRSFPEYVKMYNPSLTIKKYNDRYRQYFEYLVKLSREELIEKIKKEI